MLERFLEDSKWQPQFKITTKCLDNHKRIQNPLKRLTRSFFANLVDCIRLLTIFAKHSILCVSQGYNCVSCQTNHLFHKKSGLKSLKVSSTSKFSFIFSLSPCRETLFIANLKHVSLILN